MTRVSVKSIMSDLRVDPESWTVNEVIYGDKTLFIATPRGFGQTFSKTITTEYYFKLLRNGNE